MRKESIPAMQESAISKGMILNLSSNADVYERGERYYRDGKLLSLKSSEESDRKSTRLNSSH